MERAVSSRFSSFKAFLNVAACIISIVMLLSFPASKVHCFGAHFRSPEVRRAVERQTSVAHGESNLHESIARSGLLPTFFTPRETNSKIIPVDNFESAAEVTLLSLLNRRKLNPCGSGAQDPLLPA
jgi:hypothetical protein